MTAGWIRGRGSVIGQIELSVTLVLRSFVARLVIVILLATGFDAEFKRMLPVHPTEGFGQSVSVLHQSSRGRGTLGNTDEIILFAECRRAGDGTVNITLENVVLWNPSVRTANRVEL